MIGKCSSRVEARHLNLIMSLQMVGVFVEFERSMIQERVRAGLERARAQGKTLGRHAGGGGGPRTRLPL